MALQAPERRGNSLQEDLERAFALSRADKKLGEYFPPIENNSHAWHYDGTEHTGGGFDSDMYAFRTRGQLKKEWEVSVVQWARERGDADEGWAAEQATRNAESRKEDQKMKTIWAPEDADVEDARKDVEHAWAREQMELEGLVPTPKEKRRASSFQPVNVATPVNARRLSENYNRPQLGEESPVARTAAWLNGTGERVGVHEHRNDPTEQNELYTMETYEEELKRKHKMDRPTKARARDSGYSTPVRRPSSAASSKPPSLPSKILHQNGSVTSSMQSPRSDVQTMSHQSSHRAPSRASATTEHTARPPRRRSLLSMVSVPYTEEASVPPSLPSKNSGRGTPDSMETESRQSPRSIPDDDLEEEYEEPPEDVTEAAPESIPEAIHIYSPTVEEHQSGGARSHPASSVSRLMPTFADDKDAITHQRPLSFPVMATDSYVDLKLKEPFEKMAEPDMHVRSSASSWRIPRPDMVGNDMLLDEIVMPGMTATSEPSLSTLVAAERLVSPPSQLAQSFRQLALDAATDPNNPNYLREMNFTVPAMFSRSNLGHEALREETEEDMSPAPSQDELDRMMEEFPTPRRVTSSIPHSIRLPQPSVHSSQPPNIDKSLPGTPYTQTHSVVSTPEFDADALEAEQQTDESYYRQYRNSMPPEYSSGSKTPKGSMQKSLRNSFESFKEPRKSTGSLRSVRTGSTGAMGDAEADEVQNSLRNAERRPSKRSSKKRHKPEGSQASSDGSGSTVKASAHGRSQSSDDGHRSRNRQERHHDRASGHSRHDSSRRVRGQLPPGSVHTRISHSDSESASEDAIPMISQENLNGSVESSPLSVDTSEDGAQYVVVPESQEPRAPGRMSAHTFGLPTGTNQTFRESKDWRASHDMKNESKNSLPLTSRPQSMAPSTRSNRTRASTLRASMRSPLPDISERDTTSELSYDGGGLNPSGSFGNYNMGSGQSNEAIRYEEPEAEETPMQRLGIGPAWRADLWGAVAWDAAAARKSSSAKPKIGLNKWAAMNAARLVENDNKSGGEEVKSSSSSFGEELKENFSLGHRPGSYHDSHKHSTANEHSSGMEEQHNTSSEKKEQGSSGNSKASKPYSHNVGEVVDWHEDTEVGMAGVGAHGLRAKVSYRPSTPQKSSDGYDD